MLNKIYVGNLPYTISEQEFSDAFSIYGEILEAAIIRYKNTSKSKGFGFVTFASAAHADKALEMNGQELQGRKLKVSTAQEKSSFPREDRGERRSYSDRPQYRDRDQE